MPSKGSIKALLLPPKERRDRMTVKKVIVDNLPLNCIECPLFHSHKKDCGKEVSRNDNGAVQYGKVPDKRCKCKLR
ncbi:MAG: hypothetical protein ACOCNL_14090 [Acetivibrio ethanolgignens]